MATGAQVCEYLRPNGGWVISGDEFEGIQFYEAEPFTIEEFEAAKPLTDAAILSRELEKENAKKQLLARLGITEEEAKLLLS